MHYIFRILIMALIVTQITCCATGRYVTVHSDSDSNLSVIIKYKGNIIPKMVKFSFYLDNTPVLDDVRIRKSSRILYEADIRVTKGNHTLSVKIKGSDLEVEKNFDVEGAHVYIYIRYNDSCADGPSLDAEQLDHAPGFA